MTESEQEELEWESQTRWWIYTGGGRGLIGILLPKFAVEVKLLSTTGPGNWYQQLSNDGGDG